MALGEGGEQGPGRPVPRVLETHRPARAPGPSAQGPSARPGAPPPHRAGLAVVNTPGNMRFWSALCGVVGDGEVRALVDRFGAEQGRGAEHFVAWRRQWAADQLRRLRETPGVAGAHVMATTKGARGDLLELARDGRLSAAAIPG